MHTRDRIAETERVRKRGKELELSEVQGSVPMEPGE